MAYLLEKTSNFDEAFDLLYKRLEQLIKDFNESEVEKHWQQIADQMRALIEFCRRSSPKIVETKVRDNFWLTLIHSLLTINQIIKSSAKTNPLEGNAIFEDLNKLMNNLIESMKNSLSLTSIFEKMIDEPSFLTTSGGKLCDLRELFAIVYDNYNYEETLLQTTNNLLLNELHQHFINLKKDVNKGNTIRCNKCPVCSKSLDIENNILFHCSHIFHENCVTLKGKPPKCVLCDSSSEDFSEDGKQWHRLSLEDSTQTVTSDQKLKDSLKLTESQIKTLEYLRRGQRLDSRVSYEPIYL